MDQLTFNKFAAELAMRVSRDFPGTQLFVAVFPPGSFTRQAGPFTASTLPDGVTPMALRSLADSLERNASTTIARVKL
jgi:hypothetical protein